MPSTVAASGPILGHTTAIRNAHRRLTGHEMDWPTAIQLFDRFIAIQDDPSIPSKVFEVLIGCFLIQEGYTPEAIRRVITICAIYGSAKYAEDLDADDVEAVNMLIPTR